MTPTAWAVRFTDSIMIPTNITDRPDTKLSARAVAMFNPPCLVKRKKSDISYTISWYSVAAMMDMATLRLQIRKPMPINIPSPKLWNPSPSRREAQRR